MCPPDFTRYAFGCLKNSPSLDGELLFGVLAIFFRDGVQNARSCDRAPVHPHRQFPSSHPRPRESRRCRRGDDRLFANSLDERFRSRKAAQGSGFRALEDLRESLNHRDLNAFPGIVTSRENRKNPIFVYRRPLFSTVKFQDLKQKPYKRLVRQNAKIN